ncbi:hypothetical protein MBLNU459_g8044t1 [Dothideomycetes sp. NU459]
MLERASACLDTGVRISLRAQRRAPKTTRLLHQAFWHHGAGDLDLPPCALSSSCPPPPPPSSPADSTTSHHHHHHHHLSSFPPNHLPETVPDVQSLDAPFLDFLYPAQTLAFMNRMSTTHLDRIWDRRNARCHPAPGSRGYSSMTVVPSPSSALMQRDDTLPPAVNSTATSSTSKEPFLHLLSSKDPISASEYTVLSVWTAFAQLDRIARQDIELKKPLLNWMSQSPHRPAHSHVLEVYSHLENRHKDAAVYCAVVAAWLRLGDISNATAAHNEAATTCFVGSIGSNLLMEYAIKHDKLDLAFQIQDCFERYSQRSRSARPPKLWDRVHSIPKLDAKLISLINWLERSADQPFHVSLQKIVESLWGVLVYHLINNPKFSSKAPEGRVLRASLRKVAFKINRACIDSAPMYENCIMQLSSNKAKHSAAVSNPIISFMYNAYRRSDNFQPSPRLLSHLVDHWRHHKLAFAGRGSTRAFLTLDTIVADWKRFHARLDGNALEIIMDCYARLGDAARVESYAEHYKSLHTEGPVDPSKLWPLIYVYAERADVAAAAAQFARIKSDFGVDPDLKCWNVLLHAHVKANDVAGAISVLEKLLATKHRPDEFTFAPLLNLYGKRGELDSVDAILALGRDHGVTKPTTDMLNSRIVAYVKSGDIPGAELALEDVIQASKSGEATGSLTICFNTILTAHALSKDLDAVARFYRRMKSEAVAFDANTFGALIQAMCSKQQTLSAHALLRNVMPESKIRPLAYHYAFVMAGYVQQNMYEEALQVEKEMKLARVRPTVSTQIAALKATALLEHSRRNPDQSGEDATALEVATRDFEQILRDQDVLPIGSQPAFGLKQNFSGPALTADFLIFIHGKRRAFEVVSRILQSYQERLGENQGSDEAPLHLLTSIMSVHLRAGDYAEVDRYWALARAQADRIRLNQPTVPGSSTRKLARPKSSPSIPPGYRFLLSRPLRYYIASQFSQSSPSTITTVVSDLLNTGYAFDNRTWNAYIVALCRTSPPRALLAYRLVENFMIKDWPGWIKSSSGVVINTTIRPKPIARAERLKYIKMKYLKPDQLLPQYQTMVYMASALLELRSSEAAGYGGSARAKMSDEEKEIKRQVGNVKLIRDKAPRTLHAVQSMPRVYDRLQQRLIQKE